jgi:adenylate cyclase
LLAIGTLYRGEALLLEGQFEGGIAQIERAREALTAIGHRGMGLLSLLPLADAYGRTGLIERGLALLSEAQSSIDMTAYRLVQAELYRIKGELQLAQATTALNSLAGPIAEAEASFLRAIETARQQQAKSIELRATVSLCWLWQAQGKVTEARSLLAEIYDWFTEGFDTADLVEARRLLDALSVIA